MTCGDTSLLVVSLVAETKSTQDSPIHIILRFVGQGKAVEPLDLQLGHDWPRLQVYRHSNVVEVSQGLTSAFRPGI